MKNDQEPEGWHVPVHQSLITPILLMGLPRPFAILLAMLVLVISMPMGLWYLGIPLGVVAWGVGSWLTRLDPAWFELGRIHIRQPSVFERL